MGVGGSFPPNLRPSEPPMAPAVLGSLPTLLLGARLVEVQLAESRRARAAAIWLPAAYNRSESSGRACVVVRTSSKATASKVVAAEKDSFSFRSDVERRSAETAP